MLSACGSPEVRELPLLEHAYHPSASAPSLARLPKSDIQRLDGDVRRHVVTAPDGGQYALRWRKVSETSGPTGAGGRLKNAARMPEKGPGFVHTGKSPWGTDETVSYLRYAAWIVSAMYPGTHKLLIRDLSGHGGGHLPPHKSHRSGRDADVGWYFLSNTSGRFFKVPGDDLDLNKSWTFIEALLRTGSVRFIFIDRGIQKRLYQHALKAGWARDSLDRIFQHPSGAKRPVIRHVRGHRNHMHVRFKCPREDVDCES